jgi:Rrf2 family protein
MRVAPDCASVPYRHIVCQKKFEGMPGRRNVMSAECFFVRLTIPGKRRAARLETVSIRGYCCNSDQNSPTISSVAALGFFDSLGPGQCRHKAISMLRLTKKADYGLIALKHLAEIPEGQAQSAKDIAEAYRIPTPLLAKVLQTLARSGLVISHAGIHGGYSLGRPANQITAFEVIRSIEGPLFIASCTTSHGDCDLLNSCTVKEPLRKLNDTIHSLLNNMRISDLCEESKSEAAYARKAHASQLVTLSY